MKFTALAAVAVLALAGCSSSTPAASKPAATCLLVDSAMGQGIMSGAEAGTGAKFVRAAAVKSPDFAKVYFIAVEFSAPGISNQVGVFTSNSLTTGGGIVMAVDAFAQEFTVWPDADTSKAAISKADPSVADAKACLK